MHGLTGVDFNHMKEKNLRPYWREGGDICNMFEGCSLNSANHLKCTTCKLNAYIPKSVLELSEPSEIIKKLHEEVQIIYLLE